MFLQELKAELIKDIEYGCVVGLSALGIILNEDKETFEFDNLTTVDAMEDHVERMTRMFSKVAESNSEAFHKRFLPIFDELIKAKIIE